MAEKNGMVVVMRLSLLLFALLQSFGFSHAAESKPAWQVDWEKIVAAAKKEGEVRLWGDQEITHPDIVAAFTKEYPFIKPVTAESESLCRALSRNGERASISRISIVVVWAAALFSICLRPVLWIPLSRFCSCLMSLTG